jgi:hypothetical protein
MNMLGFFFVACGIPCAGLGFYFRKQPPPDTGGSKKQKKKDKKKKKKGGGSKKLKAESQTKAQAKEGGSLIWGGVGITVVGIGLIVWDLATK